MFSYWHVFPTCFWRTLTCSLHVWNLRDWEMQTQSPSEDVCDDSPATEINFWFSFAKSSNFLLSPILPQEKIKGQHNRWPTYLRLWSLTTLWSQKLETISEGVPLYENLHPSGSLCFSRGLASAPQLQREREGILCLPLQFLSPLPLDTVSPRIRDVSWDSLFRELLWTKGEICLWEAWVFLAGVRVQNTTVLVQG